MPSVTIIGPTPLLVPDAGSKGVFGAMKTTMQHFIWTETEQLTFKPTLNANESNLFKYRCNYDCRLQ
jgi:hypothetical protein